MFEIPLVNEATRYTEKQEVIEQLGKVLPRIFSATAEAPGDIGPILFIKKNIKDGFYRMICQLGAEWNFSYVLTGEENEN